MSSSALRRCPPASGGSARSRLTVVVLSSALLAAGLGQTPAALASDGPPVGLGVESPVAQTMQAGAAAPSAGASVPASSPLTAAEVRALAEAKGSGRPVEVVERTTETSRTLALPDGDMRLEVATQPVRHRDGEGRWQSLDLTLAARPDGRLTARSAGADAALLAPRADGSAVTLPTAAGTVTARLAGAAPVAGRVQGTRVEFPGAVGGRSLRHTLTTSGVKEELVVADRTRAEAPGAEAYSVVFTLPEGVSARAAGPVGVEFVDAAGAVVAAYGGGYAYDSARADVGQGATAEVAVALTESGGGSATVTVGVDRAWLTAPERVFPVVIDPAYRLTVNTSANGSDTWVQSNIVNTSQWADPELKTGTYDGTTRARSFLNFTTSTIPTGSLVTGATLSVNNTHSYSCSARAVDAYAVVGSAATSSTVWGNQPAVDTAIDGHATFAHGRAECPTAWAPIPVTEIAQHWVSRPSANFGLRLSASETDVFAWKRYSSGDSGAATAPVLTVDYNTDCTVYTSANTGSHSVCGAIRDRYRALGEQNSYLGYPRTSEFDVPGGRANNFEQGTILWDRTSGQTLPTGGAGYDAGSTRYFTTTDFPVTDQVSASVNVATGNLQISTAGLTAPGVSGNRTVAAVYNSALGDFLGRVGSGGYGWRFSDTPDLRLRGMGDGTQILTTASQHADVYLRRSDGSFASPPGARLTRLERLSTGEHTLTYLNTGQVLTFRADGQLIRDADRNGVSPTFTYPSSSTPSPSSITGTRGTGNRITFAYGASGTALAGRVTSLSQTFDAITRTVSYGYSSDGTLLTSITDPEGGITRFGYSGRNVTTITSPRGRVTTFAYDTSDRVTRVVQDSVTGGVNATTSLNYAATGSTVSTAGATALTGPNGGVTTYTRDAFGRVIAVRDPLNRTRRTSFSPNNEVLDTTDAMSTTASTRFEYNTDGSPTKTTSVATGVSQTLNYTTTATGIGRYLPSSSDDAQANRTSYTYSPTGNLWERRNSLGAENLQTFAYHGDSSGAVACGGRTGQLCRASDPRGGTTGYAYTSGNLTTLTPPSPLGAVRFEYDGQGRLAARTDGKAQRETYTYDRLDRLRSVTYPNGTSVSYALDADGNLISQTDPSGTTRFGYDGANRQTTKTLPSGEVITAGLDKAGNVRTLADNGGTVTYAYDAAHQVTGITEPGGAAPTISYTYNANGRRTRTTFPGSVAQTYTWTGDRLTEAASATGTSVVTKVGYGYKNSLGVETGLRQTVTDPAGTTTYGYDKVNRLTSAVTRNGTGTTTASYGYAYDGAANMTSRTVNGATRTFGYNSANQLTSRSDTTAAFTYDGNGNETTAQSGTGTPVRRATTYTQAEQADGFTVGTNAAVTQAYAGNDQVERVRSGSTTFTTSRLGLASATTGTVTDRYVREPNGSIAALRRTTSTGTASYYYLFDGLGSVVAVTDSAGAVKNRYAYDPYGNLTTRSETAGAEQPYRYAGQYQDTTTGLYKLGLRYYDPSLGRFTQQDPVGDDPTTRADNAFGNRYVYVGCNPVNFTDPSGAAWLGPCDVAGLAAGGLYGGAALAAGLTGPAGWIALAGGVVFSGGVTAACNAARS